MVPTMIVIDYVSFDGKLNVIRLISLDTLETVLFDLIYACDNKLILMSAGRRKRK